MPLHVHSRYQAWVASAQPRNLRSKWRVLSAKERRTARKHELPIPLSMKACRAPILLNFNHPVSTNTIPAGLFKGLANGGSGNGNDNNASAAKENREPMCHLIAHTRSSSTYLAHPSTTYASPPSHKMHHGAALSRTPVGGIPPPCYRSSLSQAHDCCASLSVMAPCVWGLSSRRQRT